MGVEGLKIRHSEVLIDEHGNFMLPLHPRIMSSGVEYDPKDVKIAFAETAETFYDHLSEDLDKLEGKLRRDMEKSFLSEKPRIRRDGLRQIVEPYRFDDYVNFRANWFASYLSIRGGSSHSILIEPRNEVKGIGLGSFRVTPEKLASYSVEEISEDEKKDLKFTRVFVWSHHNISLYGNARFLMEWGINYNNRLLDYLEKSGKL